MGHDIVFLCSKREWHAKKVENIRLCSYQIASGRDRSQLHPYLRLFDDAVLEGQGVYERCVSLKEEGWIPDWIINHVGFGVGFYLRDIFPEAKRAALFEWYYNAYGADVDFLANGQPVEANRRMRLRTWNAQTLLELADVDEAITPTSWQLSQFPEWMRHRFHVIHEGVDCSRLSNLRNGLIVRPKCLEDVGYAEVVTYVSRGFEEYRGFPQAMKAFSLLQKKRPNVHVLIAGNDIVAYGSQRADGRSWKEWAVNDSGLDLTRTHWLGPLQENEYHDLLAISDVHLYLTIPFVLSWSLIEAMSVGCAIVSSSTPPVEELIRNGVEGILCNFFDPEGQAHAMDSLLSCPNQARALGVAAKLAAWRYDAQKGLDGWNNLLC